MQLIVVLAIAFCEIIADNGHIKQQLHVVRFAVARNFKAVVRKSALAGFLFGQNFHVELQKVHTPLQTKHFGEESRLYHKPAAIETAHLAAHAC